MSAYRERFAAWIEAHQEEMVEVLQRFARIRSVSREDLGAEGMPFGPECARMLDAALACAREYGFETENHDGYCASVLLGDGHDAIGIAAHLDVVPEGEQWLYPPYGATRAGDFLIGRGVSDNKAPGVMGLFLLRMLRDLKVPLSRGLRLIWGLAEETGMADIRHFIECAPIPRLTLVPDSGFPTNYAQKGALRARISIEKGCDILSFEGGEVPNMVPPHATARIRMCAQDVRAAFEALGEAKDALSVQDAPEGGSIIRARGAAAHAARPESGRSAIHLLADALSRTGVVAGKSLAAMRAIAEETSDYYGANARIACEDPDTGKTTMVIGVAKSDAERVELHVDCRLSLAADLPGTEAAFAAHAESIGFTVLEMATIKPVYVPRDDARVLALQTVYAEVTGQEEAPYTMGGGTYSRYLPSAITFGIHDPRDASRPEGLPEGHGGAHAPDEFQHLPSLFRATLIYAEAILKLDAML